MNNVPNYRRTRRTPSFDPLTLLILAGVFLLLVPPTLMSQELENGTPSRRTGGDWGVTLDAQDSTRFAEHLEEDVRGRAAVLGLWGRHVVPFSSENELDVTAEASYNWSRAEIFVNLDLLRATLRLPELFSAESTVELDIGRFPFQDPSGLILRHTGDGLLARFATPRTRLQIGGLYTGLQLNPISNIRMTGADLFDENDDDVTFGPGRVVGLAELRFPEAIGRQTVVFSTLAQADVRDADDNEDTLHSAFALFGLSGRLFGNVYSDLYGAVTGGFYDDGVDDETFIGFMGSARLRIFLPELLSSRISFRGVYMSNSDDEDSADRFVPITRSTPGVVFSAPLQNIIFGEATYSLRPFAGAESARARRVQIAVSGRTYFTASDDPPVGEPYGTQIDGSVFGLDPDSDGSYVGTEAVMQINARVASDLGLGLTAGAFFPGTGSNGVFSDERKTEFLARLELSTRL